MWFNFRVKEFNFPYDKDEQRQTGRLQKDDDKNM